MKLHAQLADGSREVELITGDGNSVIARVDGREYNLTVSEPKPGVFLLKSDGKVFEASVSSPNKGQFVVSIRGNEIEVGITDPKHLRGGAAEADHSAARAEIRTAMPGKVVRVLHQVGSEVQNGDGVIVVEAMKMQNEMKSPKTGIIVEMRAAEGDTVAAGDVLVVIE